MKHAIRLLFLLLFATRLVALERYNNQCRIDTGPISANCTVTVYLPRTLNLATLFSANGITPLSNPFTASANGQFFFYAADGTYDVRLTGGSPSIGIFTIGAVSLGAGGAHPVSSFNTRTGAVLPQAGDYTAAQVTNAGRIDASNAWGVFYQDYAQNVVPPTPSSGTRRLFVDSADGHIKVKTAAGAVVDLEEGAAGAVAPSDATYITQTPNATLTAEQALSALATGYVKVTTGTGVLSSQAVPIPLADGGTAQTSWTGSRCVQV